MTDKEYNKMIADVRRSVSRKYGFRQSSYVNFKVESGYFFCLYFLTGDVRLTVKPMYADDCGGIYGMPRITRTNL